MAGKALIVAENSNCIHNLLQKGDEVNYFYKI